MNQGNVHHDLFFRSPPDSNPSPKTCKGLLCLALPPPTLEGEGLAPTHQLDGSAFLCMAPPPPSAEGWGCPPAH